MRGRTGQTEQGCLGGESLLALAGCEQDLINLVVLVVAATANLQAVGRKGPASHGACCCASVCASVRASEGSGDDDAAVARPTWLL